MLAGCTKKESTIFLNRPTRTIAFNNTVELHGELINIEVLGASNLHIIDTFLLFQTPKLDQYYAIYTLNKFTNCGHFINKGQGPNDFSTCLTPIHKIEEDVSVLFYDYNSNDIISMNLSETVKRQHETLSKTPIKIKDINNIYQIYPINKIDYFVNFLDIDNLNQHYAIWNDENKKLLKNDIVLNSQNISIDNSYLLATYCRYNEKKKIYVSAMNFVDQINFHSIESNEKSFCISISDHITDIKDIEKIEMPEKIEYYTDLRSSDSYLFALYANQSRKDWAVNQRPAKIQVFDWEGNPILEIKTKEKIIRFDIDANNNKVYGITEAEELYCYDLADFI